MDSEISLTIVNGEVWINRQAPPARAYTKPRAIVTKSNGAMNLESLSDALEDIKTPRQEPRSESNASNHAEADCKAQRDLPSTHVRHISIPRACQRSPRDEDNEEDKASAPTIYANTITKTPPTADDITKACANLTITNDPFLLSPPKHFFTEIPCIADLDIPKTRMRRWIKSWFEGRGLSAKELQHYHTFIDKMRPTMQMFVCNKGKRTIPMLNASGLEDSICSRMVVDMHLARMKQGIRLLPFYNSLQKAGKINGPFQLQHIRLTYAVAERQREKEQTKNVPNKGASKPNAQARRHKKEQKHLKTASKNSGTQGKDIV